MARQQLLERGGRGFPRPMLDSDSLVLDPPIIEDSEDSQDGYFLSEPEWPY